MRISSNASWQPDSTTSAACWASCGNCLTYKVRGCFCSTVPAREPSTSCARCPRSTRPRTRLSTIRQFAHPGGAGCARTAMERSTPDRFPPRGCRRPWASQCGATCASGFLGSLGGRAPGHAAATPGCRAPLRPRARSWRCVSCALPAGSSGCG